MNDFSDFLDVSRSNKLGSWNFLLNISLWSPVLPVFPDEEVPHSWSPPWTSFTGVLKVSSCSGYDLTLLKADGEWLFSCQFFSGFGYFNLQCSSPPTSPIPHCPNPWITHTPWRVSRGNSSNVLFFHLRDHNWWVSMPPFPLSPRVSQV